MQLTENIQINRRILNGAVHNPEKAAKAVELVYVNSGYEGFRRKHAGNKFHYFDGKNRVKDKEHLERIKKLRIPPAWENVWICKLHNGHLQATGFDKLNRKQYIYHPLWNTIRSQTKFIHLYDFGKHIPEIRNRIKKDLSLRGFPKEKVLAAAVSLMEHTNIRIGNSQYEKLYGSYGLTTLKNKHVKVDGHSLIFSFKGKKGVKHNITLKNKKLVKIVLGCKEIPGKELFTYKDEEGIVHSIDSGMLNDYIRNITGGEFTAKDFRTWAGSVSIITAFRELGGFETVTEMKKKVPAALDKVAELLGNTRAVCKKYYVHPALIELYESQKIDKYLTEQINSESDEDLTGYTPEELILLKILQKN